MPFEDARPDGFRFLNEISEVHTSGSAIQAHRVGTININACQHSGALVPPESYSDGFHVKSTIREDDIPPGVDWDPNEPVLRVQSFDSGSASWVAFEVTGELDTFSANRLQNYVIESLASRSKWSLILDLRKLEFIDAAGMRCLARCFSVCHSLGGFCHLLVRPGGHIYRALRIVGVDTYISPNRSIAAAVSSEVEAMRSHWKIRTRNCIADF